MFENLFWEPCFAWKSMFLEILLRKLAGNLAWSWKSVPGNTCLKTCSGNLVLLGKRFLKTLKTVPEIRACKTCSWEPCLGTLLGNLFLETSSWEPLLGKLFLRTLLGNLFFLPFLGALAWEPLAGNPCLGTLAWEPVPGNLAWRTCSWEPCLETLLGNLFLGTWEPLPGNPVPNLALCGFGCSAVRIWLLRPAPEPLLWLKTRSVRRWGKICSWISCLGNVAWKP